ncbi:MAG: hypothetical protein ACRD3H_08775 [Terriglobales bacterium]
MAETATANLADFEPAAVGATASLDEFQPATLPEVDQAIRSVPRPKFVAPKLQPVLPELPERFGETGPLPNPKAAIARGGEGALTPSNPAVRDIQAMGQAVRAVGNAPAPVDLPSPGAVRAGAPVPQQPGDTPEQIADRQAAISGGIEAGFHLATPVMAAGAIMAPVPAAASVIRGFAGSQLAKYGTQALGGGPEARRLAENVGWLATPAGIGKGAYEALPEEPVARAEALFRSLTYKAGQTVPEHPTFEQAHAAFRGAMQNLHPDVNPDQAEYAQTLNDAWTTLKQSGRFNGAAPPMPPPTDIPQAAPPQLPPVPHPGAPVDTFAEGASNAVAMANEEAQAMRMVSGLPPTPPPLPAPPAPAPPIPQQIANGHITPSVVQEIGKQIAEAPPELQGEATLEAHQKLTQAIQQMGKVVTPTGQIEIVTKPEQADKIAQRLINDETKRQEKAVEEKQKTSGQTGSAAATTETAPRVQPLSTPAMQTAHVDQIQEEPQTAKLGDFAPLKPPDVTPSAVPSSVGSASLSDLAPTNLLKGDPVLLPGGARATVSWVSPRLSIVRVKTDAGKVLSIGARQLKSAQQEPITPAGMVKRPPTQENPKQPARKNNSTQINLPQTAAAKVNKVQEASVGTHPHQKIIPRERIAGTQGSETTLNMASGNLPAKYRVVEAADLQPSHDANTFGRNPEYPDGVQERTYDTSKEAQARVIQQTQNYDPNYTINTNPDAVNGPPIITPDGIVLGGNSRAMSTQRLYKSGKGNNYKSALLAQAQTFGLDIEGIRSMKEPVLVREVTQPASLEATRRLASDLNKSMTGALGVSERAVSAGKSITRESLEKVAAVMDSMGADTSLRDLMRERGNALVSMLVKDGAITERERPQFVDTATGGLSDEGKTFVERALLGSVVDDPRLMDSTPKLVLNKLDGSLAALASLAPRTDAYNILPIVRSALHDHAQIASNGSNVETFLNQNGLFGGDRVPVIDAITRLLAEKPTMVKQRLRQFARDAGLDVQGQETLGLSEPPGPAKAFNDAFGARVTDDELADAIVRAAQIEPMIGASHEAGTSGSAEANAGNIQRRPTGETRPGGSSGATTPTEGARESETGNQLDLLKSESGSFEPGKLAAPVAELIKQDVAPALKKAGIGLSDSAGLFIKAFYPRIEESNLVGRWTRTAAPSDAVDALMKLKGDRARALSEFDAVLSGIEKMFDKLPDSERVDFIDRLQTGTKQPTQELDGVASALRTIMDEQRRQEEAAANLGRRGQQIELSRKENYFHNWWNTPPGREPEADDHGRISRLFSPKRPLEGSKGYNKKQSYTLKSGMAAGGVPETTNPVRVLRHRIEDGMKFVTARVAWDELHNLDLRTFVKPGQRPPAGFDKIDDKIAKVYFPAWLDFPGSEEPIKVSHQLGEWYVEANTARLLKNMLSLDKIRATAAGRSLMWLKNASTALELGLSPFHAVFETIEAASSQLALGLQRSYNLGFRRADLSQLGKGIMEMATSPVAPITLAREGAALPAYVEARVRLAKMGPSQYGSHQVEGEQPHGIADAIPGFRKVRKLPAVRKLLKQYPDLDQLVDDMFTGGLIIGQHRDYQVRALGKTASEAWTANNPLGAILRAGMSLPQAMMKPLFQWYIPNLKYSLFLKMMGEQAVEHAAELEDGSLTRATVARRVADSVENRFGELNFDNLFLNRTVKTALQFAFRSVTYKLGTAREFVGAGGGQAAEFANWARQAYDSAYTETSEAPGKLPRLDPRASWVLSLLFTTVAMGSIASKLLTGKYPWEWLEDDKKEGGGDLHHLYLETVHPRTGDTDSRKKPVRISLPTYWKDVEHVSSSPSQYVLSSLSSTLSKGLDLTENRDYFGNYVYNPHASFETKAKQAGKYSFPMPFSISNYQRGKQMNEPKTAWLSAFGFPRAPSDLDFTPAEKALRDVIKDSRAPATPEQMEAWRAKREAYEQGKLSAAEARRFIKQERDSFLEREFKNSAVTYTDAVRIHNLATPEEKPLLDRLLRMKRANQLKRYGAGEVERKEAEAAR